MWSEPAAVTGACGLTVFCLLFVLAAGRLASAGCGERGAGGLPRSAHRRFYLLVLAFSACDVPQYAATVIERRALEFQTSLWPRAWYSLHLVSMALQVVAITVVIRLWGSAFKRRAPSGEQPAPTTRRRSSVEPRIRVHSVDRSSDGFSVVPSGSASPRAADAAPRIPASTALFTVLNGLLGLATVVVVVELMDKTSPAVPMGKALEQSVVYMPFVVVVAVSLFACGAGVLAFGLRVHFRIASHPWDQRNRLRIRRLLRRLNCIMTLVTLCFLMRVVLLLMLFSNKVKDNEVLSEWVWHLMSYWIPAGVPTTLLLFLMRGPSSSPQRSRAITVGGAAVASLAKAAQPEKSALMGGPSKGGTTSYGGINATEKSALLGDGEAAAPDDRDAASVAGDPPGAEVAPV